MEELMFDEEREENVEKLIRKKLDEGRIVMCERLIDQRRDYKGVKGNIEEKYMDEIERIEIDGDMKEMKIVIDI